MKSSTFFLSVLIFVSSEVTPNFLTSPGISGIFSKSFINSVQIILRPDWIQLSKYWWMRSSSRFVKNCLFWRYGWLQFLWRNFFIPMINLCILWKSLNWSLHWFFSRISLSTIDISLILCSTSNHVVYFLNFWRITLILKLELFTDFFPFYFPVMLFQSRALWYIDLCWLTLRNSFLVSL